VGTVLLYDRINVPYGFIGHGGGPLCNNNVPVMNPQDDNI
jgi:hypothetical protein